MKQWKEIETIGKARQAVFFFEKKKQSST